MPMTLIRTAKCVVQDLGNVSSGNVIASNRAPATEGQALVVVLDSRYERRSADDPLGIVLLQFTPIV